MSNKPSTEKELAVVNSMQSKIEKLPETIESEEDAFLVADALLSIREIFNTVEEKRKSYTAPFNEGVKKINTDFKPMTDPLKEWEGKLGTMLDVYADTREDTDAKKLKKMREETGDQALMIPLGIKALPASSGEIRFRKGYDVVVTDVSAVPSKYLVVDTKAVEKDVKAQDGQIEIPGIAFRPTHTHAVYLK